MGIFWNAFKLGTFIFLFTFIFRVIPCDIASGGFQLCEFTIYNTADIVWFGFINDVVIAAAGSYVIILLVINFLLMIITPMKVKDA